MSASSGGGSEYPAQDGSGWTDAVMRKLIAGHRMRISAKRFIVASPSVIA
jgi:neutral trehalase